MVNTFPAVQPFVGLRDAMDQLFNESVVSSPYRTLWSRGGGQGGGHMAPLPLDVYATTDEVVVLAALPGVAPEALDLTINQTTITLAGEIPNPAQGAGEGATWYLNEAWHGTFRRSVTLPFEVDADRADASFEHGVLRVSLPKAARVKPQKIAIKAGGTAQAIGGGGSEGSQG